MTNLNFKPKDGMFVTDNLDGGSNGIVAFQLAYPTEGARVIVETCVDEKLGWVVAESKTAIYQHSDIISGVLEGLNVRIRTNIMPIKAKITTL